MSTRYIGVDVRPILNAIAGLTPTQQGALLAICVWCRENGWEDDGVNTP